MKRRHFSAALVTLGAAGGRGAFDALGVVRTLGAVGASAALGALAAQPRALRAQDDGGQHFAAGGVAVLLRHAQTEPGIGDPPGFRLGDCATQRNLSAAGRAQARRIGDAFRARGLRIDEVRSSRWCRCLDTARLAFPRHPVQPFAALDSFFDDRSSEPRQSAQVSAYVAALGTRNALLVTHMVNIAALAGEGVGMGEAMLLRADGRGGVARIGRLSL
jgi:broad specificity phosphatase PhoE